MSKIFKSVVIMLDDLTNDELDQLRDIVDLKMTVMEIQGIKEEVNDIKKTMSNKQKFEKPKYPTDWTF